MKRAMLPGLALALGLGAAPPVHAQGYSPERPPNGYWGQPDHNEYRPPRQEQGSEVMPLADRLVQDSAGLRDRVNREVPPGQESGAALHSIGRLEYQAQRFDQTIRQEGPQSEVGYREFSRLTRAFTETANDVQQLQGYPGVRRDFERVRGTIDELAPMFGGYGAYRY